MSTPPDPSQILAQLPPEQMPDLGQPGSVPPNLAGSPGSPQYAAAQNRPPVPVPILQQLIQGIARPQMVASAPGEMARPESRASVFEHFLGNFVQALGQGMAAAHGPGAFGKGMGAAVAAPYQQSLQQFQVGQQAQANQADIQQRQAQAQLESAQAGMYGQTVMTPYGPMNQALAAKVFPAMIRAQGQTQSAQIGGQSRIQAAQLGLGPMADVPQDLQEQLGLPAKLPVKMLNQAESAANKPLTVVQGANDAFVANKQTGAKKALGVGSGRIAATLARPVQVGDPNNPGGTMYVPAGEAMRKNLPGASSASVTVPKGVLKDFTSGASAKTLNAFNTASDHLQILSQLGDALQNGSTPLVNRFANAYASQTGGAAPNSFNMAKQAVAGEIAKTFKGNATDSEMKALDETINAAQSPAQLKGAIGTAMRLMNSKREALMGQYNAGIKASPAFPKEQPTGKVDSVLKRLGL